MIVTQRKALAAVDVAEREGNRRLTHAYELFHRRQTALWLQIAAQHAAIGRERESADRSRALWLRMLVAERRRRDAKVAEQRRQLGVWLHGRAAGYRADADTVPSKPKTGPLTDDMRRAIADELEDCARDIAGLDLP